jgi:hypothetical protein
MDNEKLLQVEENVTDSTSSPDQTRRRLTGGALGASVIMTLASTPVLGATQCLTPSGFLSGSLSVHGTPPSCTGLTPGYWGTHPSAWFAPKYGPGTCATTGNGTCQSYKADGTPFNVNGNLGPPSGSNLIPGVFKTGPFNPPGFLSLTCMQVIQLGGNGDPSQLGMHIVAALLNAYAGYTPVLKVSDVIGIWNDYVAKGYFEPSAGVQWGPAAIVRYLSSTMS